jgi:predicted amidophosphoribosyltransferase
VRAALSFDGATRSAILALKFGNRRALAQHLAGLMVRRLGLGAPGALAFDVVTWAPTSRARAARRGFDQAELLARHIARDLGVPCRRLLYRAHGSPQTGHTRDERLAGPSFRSRRTGRPLRVLVVDDVVTTGATLHAAAASLAAAGIHDVCLEAAAATPDSARPAGRPVVRHLPSTRPLAPVVSLAAHRSRALHQGASVVGAPPGRLESA